MSIKINNKNQYSVAVAICNTDFWDSVEDYEIPYNQRSYSWNETNITQYMDDLYNHYKGIKSFYTFGIYTFLIEENKKRTIYDGQQRIISSFLLLSAIQKYALELGNDIETEIKKHKNDTNENLKNELCCENQKCKETIKNINNYIFKFNDKQCTFIPKLYSVHHVDNIIFKLLMKLEIESYKQCYETCGTKFKCLICNKEHVKKEQMEKHVINCDKGDENNKYQHIVNKYRQIEITDLNHITSNRMIDAQYTMLNYLKKYIKTFGELHDIYKLFSERIPHDEYICKNSECASNIFDVLNGRGMKLEHIDIIRNAFIRLISNDKQKHYFDKFQDALFNPLQNKNKQFILNDKTYLQILIGMASNHIENVSNITEKYKLFFGITEQSATENFNIIGDCSKLLLKIQTKIERNKWGSIYMLEPCDEIFINVIIPFFKIYSRCVDFDASFTKLMEIIVCYQIKSGFIKARNYNYLKNELFHFGNKIYSNQYNNLTICTDFTHIVNVNLLKNVSSDIFNELKTKELTAINCRKILFYCELKQRLDGEHDITKSNVDIEHIKPKSAGENNLIGNVTLLHKGLNRSLQDSPFADKIKKYHDSNCRYVITKKIKSINGVDWTDEDIQLRCDEFINNLILYTNAVLLNNQPI